MTARDLITIIGRLPMIWYRRSMPATPWPWSRCHCGDFADLRSDFPGYPDWCSPCKYAGHDTCECSQEVDDDSA